MAKSVAARRQRLPRVKPRVALLWLLTLGLVGYYAFWGIRYWQATKQVAQANSGFSGLSASLRQSPPNQAALATALRSGEEKLKALDTIFGQGETDDLVAMVSASAQEAGVSLLQVATGDPQPKTSGAIQYQTQLLSVVLQGEKDRISRFLTLLRQKAPAVAVAGFGLSGLDASPSAQMQLLFYCCPEAVPGKGESKKEGGQ